ncbi:SGNH-hydro domain-containing protein [Fusarium sp. LHS14.1]|nr:SGNH-hydro domain-containing protein [Fusarium sp. LHS14.1]
MSNHRAKEDGQDTVPMEDESSGSCSIDLADGDVVLKYKQTEAGEPVKKGTKLRILPVGDSITVGYLSDRNGGDSNGYRGQLKKDLSGDEVIFAGTESSGTMSDGYYAAWSGKTIQYISDHVGPSLEQRPNIILLAAGTNDMNPNRGISKEGNDPEGAADRLGKLVDKMIKECPDATILVAMIINTCDEKQSPATKEFQKLIPDVVKSRREDGHQVLAVDFTTFKTSDLQDCIHPTNSGYKLMGDYWYSFIHQIPTSWIKKPIGSDPNSSGSGNNGGIDKNIPAPDWGKSPVQVTSKETVADAAESAKGGKSWTACNKNPIWKGAGKIAQGNVGHNGDWKYHKNWVAEGEVAEGLGWDTRYVRLHDMNGDGKADYVWIHPKTGEIRCWLNDLPKPWSPAGNNNSIIGSGVGPAETIFLADLNGDGMDDYLVVDPDNGSVRVWWNYGPDENWVNGWRFVPGGQIASGVPHANLETLRFPDVNGDGRADYVYIGEGGSLKHHMNTGSAGGQDVLFHAMGGIATGAVRNLSNLVFADMNGDGRDDYLTWDDDGGLTGFLNQPTNREGVPLFINQGDPKTIADGIKKDPSTIRLADMNGDGKDDYVYVGKNGALSVWYNRGTTDDSMTIDGLRFADIDGDGIDDYIWLDPNNLTLVHSLNAGVDDGDSLGWAWKPLNGGKAWYNDYPNKPTWREAGGIAGGVGTSGANVRYGTLSSTGRTDYIPVDRKTGAIAGWLNGCNNFDASEKKHKITIFQRNVHGNKRMWGITEYPLKGKQPKDHCGLTGKYSRSAQISPDDPDDAEYPTLVTNNDKIYGKECYYIGSPYSVGQLYCDGVSGIVCYKDPDHWKSKGCGGWSYRISLSCKW